MTNFWCVALGGAIGTTCRYYLSGVIMQRMMPAAFPLGTFAVNMIGCLLAGILLGLSERLQFLTAESRIFIFGGVLGGFTTFSAFTVETVTLLKRGDIVTSLLYILLSVTIGIAAVWLGWRTSYLTK